MDSKKKREREMENKRDKNMEINERDLNNKRERQAEMSNEERGRKRGRERDMMMLLLSLVLLQLVIAIAFTKVAPTTPATTVDAYRVPYPVNTTAALACTGVMAAIIVCARVCVCLRGSTYPPSHGGFSDSSSISHSHNVSRSPSVPPLLAASLPPS